MRSRMGRILDIYWEERGQGRPEISQRELHLWANNANGLGAGGDGGYGYPLRAEFYGRKGRSNRKII
jgi:hypothetical protein